MGLWDFVEGGAKKIGGGAKSVGKALVNEDAWGDVMHGRADWKDYANVALDASMLIPGAGMAGMAGRGLIKGGARLGANQALKGSAEKSLASSLLANKATDTARRTALKEIADAGGNRTVAKLTGSSAQKLAGQAPLGAARAGATAGDDAIARVLGKKVLAGQGAKAGAKPTGREIAKATNRKVGLAQTRKGVAGGVIASGGLNTLDMLLDMIPPKGPVNSGDDNRAPATGKPPGFGGTFYLKMGPGSDPVPLPAAFQGDPAGFIAQGGAPAGAQVIFMSN